MDKKKKKKTFVRNKNVATQKCQKLQLFIQTKTFLKAIRKMWQHACYLQQTKHPHTNFYENKSCSIFQLSFKCFYK